MVRLKMDSKENTGGQNTFKSFLCSWRGRQKNSSNYKIILFIFASKDLMLIIFFVFFTAESNCPVVKHNHSKVFKGFKVPDEHSQRMSWNENLLLETYHYSYIVRVRVLNIN